MFMVQQFNVELQPKIQQRVFNQIVDELKFFDPVKVWVFDWIQLQHMRVQLFHHIMIHCCARSFHMLEIIQIVSQK